MPPVGSAAGRTDYGTGATTAIKTHHGGSAGLGNNLETCAIVLVSSQDSRGLPLREGAAAGLRLLTCMDGSCQVGL